VNRDPWTPVVVFGVLLAGCVSTSCVAPKAASKRRRTITQERADLGCEQFIQPAPAPATRGERSRHNSDRDKSGVQRLNPSGLSVVIVNDFPEGKAPQANTWVYALTAGALSWLHPLQSNTGELGSGGEIRNIGGGVAETFGSRTATTTGTSVITSQVFSSNGGLAAVTFECTENQYDWPPALRHVASCAANNRERPQHGTGFHLHRVPTRWPDGSTSPDVNHDSTNAS
jgi:hypothetical protein